MQQAQRFPILRHDEEREMAELWQAAEDPEAAEHLLGSHLRLVIKIARGFQGYGLPLDELSADVRGGLPAASLGGTTARREARSAGQTHGVGPRPHR